jgi:hypothetical protein
MTACQERDASPICLRSSKERVEQRNRLRAAAWTDRDFVRKPKPQRRPLGARLHSEHLGPRSGFLDTLTFPLSIAPLQVRQRAPRRADIKRIGNRRCNWRCAALPIHRRDDANKHCTKRPRRTAPRLTIASELNRCHPQDSRGFRAASTAPVRADSGPQSSSSEFVQRPQRRRLPVSSAHGCPSDRPRRRRLHGQ